MNKTAIKTFAIEARKKLIASVMDKAGLLGITDDNPNKPEQKGAGYEVCITSAGTEYKIFEKEIRQRQSLVNRIKEKGYDNVMEEVAYTWFNRIIAIRFMEVNDYLPTRIRVLSSETENKTEPDIVTQAPNIDLDFADAEKEKVYMLKAENKLDDLFSMLFIKQCNKLGEILPELFEKVSDYTELLLNVSYTNKDGIIRMLVDNIDECDFKDQVQIIGWLYQYYNTELKDDTFALMKKNVKITKERIPAATQLFTPDWIVRYMVENSLGRLWLEHLKAEDRFENNDKINSLKSNWRYYLDEAEQEKNVALKLNELRKNYINLKPEDIKIIDPCMGSGHILVYAFDVLMDIYKKYGYSERDAASLIIQNNLFGLEIDDRAYQLAYFAVMMKGRKYDRRFLTRNIIPNLCAIQESNSLQTFESGAGQQKLNDLYKNIANYLIDSFKDAKEFGSILNIEQMDYDGLISYIEDIKQKGAEDLFISTWLSKISEIIPILIKQAKIMSQKYDVVITNPPYMGSNGMDTTLSEYLKKNYSDSKSDLFAVFIEKCETMLKKNGMQAMITQHSWMFLSSFEKLREKLLHKDIINMAHLGARAFEEICGEVVQTTAFVVQNSNINGYKAYFLRLVGFTSQLEKEKAFLAKNSIHMAQKENFCKIPGMPIAYWVSRNLIKAFDSGNLISTMATPKQGMSTCDVNRFVKLWFEVDIYNTNIPNKNNHNGWIRYNKGGEYRKWYGNQDSIVLWNGNGDLLKANKAALRNQDSYFDEFIAWTKISSSSTSFRNFEENFLFDGAGGSLFLKDNQYKRYFLGFLNSKVCSVILNVISPTLNFNESHIGSLPIIINEIQKEKVNDLVNRSINFSKLDWDLNETSWDFGKHPLIKLCHSTTAQDGYDIAVIKDVYNEYEFDCNERFNQLKANEEELNCIFIEIYGLQDELTPDVNNKDITVTRIYDSKNDIPESMKGNNYILTKSDVIKSLISYAVGCMFGRYSLDIDGLVYAGGSWEDVINSGKYKTFIPDIDNIILISEEEYFEDDIVGLFVEFVKTVYGEETLEENLDFIANTLGNKGVSSRDIIRNYFVKDFYNDHLKVYQKRPIYWQFDSGKENGFKALIYMHRYDKDTVGRVRADYLHKVQTALENSIKSADYIIETTLSNVEKSKAAKSREKYIKQLAETRVYDEALAYIAHQRIVINLDDGVKTNYAKFQNVELSSEGKKTQKINLLTKI